jgi:hypothetical protein
MRHITGTSIDPDGTIYHDEVRHNMKHGSGIQHDIDGGEFKGSYWEGNGTYRMDVGKGMLGGPEKTSVRIIAL